MIEVVAHDASVNIVFFGGADFDPPPPLGTTDRPRYIKVTRGMTVLSGSVQVGA